MVKKDWNKIFATAHLDSWPVASLSISNRKPCDHAGARNVFKDERAEIEKAASQHGYYRATPDTAAVICFLRK